MPSLPSQPPVRKKYQTSDKFGELTKTYLDELTRWKEGEVEAKNFKSYKITKARAEK
ncbi:hypothetical protein EPUL_006666, partial [Erysiphe pulchra]